MRFVLAALAFGGCSAVAQSPASGMPEWMSGYWLSCEHGETAENWIGAGRRAMVGVNLTGAGYEFLRIAADDAGRLVYYSMPSGRSPPTPFTLTNQAGQRAVFENAAHDFPKRIIYERQGNLMTARIDGGEVSEQAMAWRFQRAAPDARCKS